MINTQRNLPSADDLDRAERVRETIEYLRDINEKTPVIVEGKKDAAALRDLGLIGDIITLHNGKNLYDFCDDVSKRFHRVILLLDWDRKGEDLNRTLSRHLRGQWEEFSSIRDLLKILCQKEIKDVEGIPKLLRRLEGNENPWL